MAPDLDDRWDELTGRDALLRFAPDAAAALRALEATIAVSARDVTLVRRSCAETLGLDPLPDIERLTGDEHTGRDQIAVVLAGQFSIDVSATDDELRGRLSAEYGRQGFELVQMIWVADMVPRVRAALDRLFHPAPDGWPMAPDGGTAAPWPLVEEFNRVVYNLHELDPVTSEVVRLRGARQHRCRLCSSLRSRPALDAGANEELFDTIDTIDALDALDALDDGPDSPATGPRSPRHRAAMALTDAMIWRPADIEDRVVDDVHRHFRPSEAVELVLDVMRNAANKIAVALAADAARVTEGTEVYDIDEDGTMRFEPDAPT